MMDSSSNSQVLNGRIVRNHDVQYFVCDYENSIWVYLFDGESGDGCLFWRLVLTFPKNGDIGMLSYTLLEVVDIVQWHVDNALSF